MIPKIIHYAWFSDPPDYPEDVVNCMKSWKEKMPDYEIKLWNAHNFDFSVCRYAQEAFEVGKFAFASDYVRLWALYHYGGIYLDSDIEVLKTFDDLLDQKAFTCFEDTDRIAAWIFGSEKGNPLFQEFMDDYRNRRFIYADGLYDLTPNPEPITKRLEEHGLILNGQTQKLDQIMVYSMDYFCPYNPYRKSGDCFTENTYANHHFTGNWKVLQTEKERMHDRKKEKWIKIFGYDMGMELYIHFSRIKYEGLCQWLKEVSVGKIIKNLLKFLFKKLFHIK